MGHMKPYLKAKQSKQEVDPSRHGYLAVDTPRTKVELFVCVLSEGYGVHVLSVHIDCW